MNMRRKFCLLLSCLAFIGMFTWGTLPTEAAACSHNICYVAADPIATGVVFSYNDNTHTIEYGTEHICGSCGYRFFKDTYSRTESHQFSAGLRLVEEGTNYYIYAADCNDCPASKYYYRAK